MLPNRRGCVTPPQLDISWHWASVRGAGQGACCRLFANPTRQERDRPVFPGQSGEGGSCTTSRRGLAHFPPGGQVQLETEVPSPSAPTGSSARPGPGPAEAAASAQAWPGRQACCGPASTRAAASRGPATHHSRTLSWRKLKGPVGPSSCSQISQGQDLSPHGMALQPRVPKLGL